MEQNITARDETLGSEIQNLRDYCQDLESQLSECEAIIERQKIKIEESRAQLATVTTSAEQSQFRLKNELAQKDM